MEPVTDEQSNATEELPVLLKEYDRALWNDDFETVAILSTRINELRGAKPLEPSPENSEADAEKELLHDLLPVDKALLDQKPRTFYLHCGIKVTGTVQDANLANFTVVNGRSVWTVVRSTVEAIRLDASELEQTPAR